MGAGTMWVADYHTPKAYYLKKDCDAKLGGDFWFLIKPLMDEENAFFYVKELENGKFEVEGEGYIITDPDRVAHYVSAARSDFQTKTLYYYHRNAHNEIIRKESAK